MADLFLSYSSQDRPRAKELADALTAQGFSVWWDRKIPTGEAFDDELGRQIEAARAIVVLWSPNSVASRWVKDEASEGLSRKTLFPVMLAQTRLPFGYRRIQTADFRDWQPGTPHLGFDQLVASLRRGLAGGGTLELDADHPAPPPVRPNWLVDHWRRSIAFRLLTLLLPALVMAAGALVMMQVHWPVRALMELPVQRVTLNSARAREAAVLNLPPFIALTVERFQAISLKPLQLRAASAEHLEQSGISSSPWHEITVPAEGFALLGQDPSVQPSVRMERSDVAGVPTAGLPAGQLDALRLAPGSRLTLARHGKRPSLLLSVDGETLNPSLVAHGPLRIDTVNVAPLGGGKPEPMVYDVVLRESSPELRIVGSPGGLTLKLSLPPEKAVELVGAGGLAIDGISLIHMPQEDRWSSTLVADATLSFPDHPGLAPISVPKSDLLGIDGLAQATLLAAYLDPKVEGFVLRVDGRAAALSARSGEFTRDLRPTLLQLYRSSANAVFLVTLVLGAVSATWSLFMAWRELRS